MKNFKFALFFVLLFSSCSVYHNGLVTNTTSLMSDKSYKYEDIAVGYSKVSYFLGIGGQSKDLLASEAKRNLYLAYPLKANQTIENMTTNYKVSYHGFRENVETIIMADVIDHDSTYNVRFNNQYFNFITTNKIKTVNEISLNEKVVIIDKYGYEAKGRIVELLKDKASVFHVDYHGDFRISELPYNKIFKTSGLETFRKEKKYNFGDRVVFLSLSTDPYEGTLIGLNNKYGLLKMLYTNDLVSVKIDNISTKK